MFEKTGNYVTSASVQPKEALYKITGLGTFTTIQTFAKNAFGNAVPMNGFTK